MIEQTNAIKVLNSMLSRTEALLEAIERIKAYNWKYQNDITISQPALLSAVRDAQDRLFKDTVRSCSEHALISLTTAFEVFLSVLIQELLFCFPTYFLSKNTIYTEKVRCLVEESEINNYEDIENKLKLGNRSTYYGFLETYDLDSFEKEDKDFIEYLYTLRNLYVHCGGIVDKKSQERFKTYKNPFKENEILTIAKRSRTKIKTVLKAVYKRLMTVFEEIL